MTNLASKFSKTGIFTAFAGAVILFSIPAVSFASEAAFAKYYRASASSVGNLGCPSGWTQVDSWSIDEGDSADGGGGTHTGLACTSSAYKAAFAKYYRTGSPTSFPPCPSGWTTIDTWAVQEGDKNDGGGSWHGGVACASNSYQSAISKYYRERAGGNPSAAWTGNVDQCPAGPWTKIDSWSVYEGDGSDGGGGQHDGFACAYTGSDYTKTYMKYYRTGNSAILPSCATGWNQIDSWSVWEGDPADGGGGVHSGVACAAPVTTGTVKIRATKDGQPWDSPPLVVDVTTPVGRMNVTADPPDELRDVPAGTYAVHNVTAPSGAGVTLVDFLPGTAMQNLPAGGTITFTFNFVTTPPATGTVVIKATKTSNGVTTAWDSPPFDVNYTGPSGPVTASFDPEQTITGVPTGTYSVISVTAPPGASVTYSSVTPSSQTLSTNGTITFTFNFTTTAVALPPTLMSTPTSVTVNTGGVQQFNAIYDPDGSGSQYPYYVTNSSNWSSSNTSVATVNSIGSATGANTGSATITANYAGLSAPASLTVSGAPQSILVITPISATINVGNTQKFDVFYDWDGPSGPYPPYYFAGAYGNVWSSSDNSIATIGSNGIATGVRAGSVTITALASFAGMSTTASLSVIGVATPTATLSASPTTINRGQSSTLTWSSTNATSCAGVGFSTGGATSGSVPVSPSATTSYQVTCTGPGGSANSNIVTVTVTVPSLPDLIAGAVSPTAAVAGTATTFSATVSNSGTGSTVSGFTNLFQRATDSSGTGATDIGTSALSALPAGGTATASLSYTFMSPGTFYLRVCADKGFAGDTGTIAESNETNNCGAWTAVTTAPAALPPAVTLSASRVVIDRGNSSTLTWSSTNATSCSTVGGFSTGGATSGSVSVSPSATSNYQVTCTGPGGSVNSNIVTVTVVSVTASISAVPTCISGGGSSTISWSATPVSQAASCNVSGPGLSSTQLTGSQTVNVTSKSTYVVACQTISGSTVTKQAIVDVSGCWAEF